MIQVNRKPNQYLLSEFTFFSPVDISQFPVAGCLRSMNEFSNTGGK